MCWISNSPPIMAAMIETRERERESDLLLWKGSIFDERLIRVDEEEILCLDVQVGKIFVTRILFWKWQRIGGVDAVWGGFCSASFGYLNADFSNASLNKIVITEICNWEERRKRRRFERGQMYYSIFNLLCNEIVSTFFSNYCNYRKIIKNCINYILQQCNL